MEAPPIARQLASEEYARFRIFARAEIVGLLVGLEEERSPVTLYFNNTSFIVSRVLSVDTTGKAIILDLGSDPVANEQMMAAPEVLAVTTLHNVTLEFSLGPVHPLELDDGPAIRAALPEFMLRLQRRENFRVPTPVLRPVSLALPGKDAGGPALLLRITDISCGGLGVESDASAAHLKTGDVLDNCRFDLPEVGQVVAAVEVRHIDRNEEGNKLRLRFGLRFLTLSPQMAALVQRYVMKLEREWRALR
ncbi:MAG TPA: flagellar brake protein [Burkholderiales bacterium]|nr:flagellar brake protein [Burkholderiales bacterium]